MWARTAITLAEAYVAVGDRAKAVSLLEDATRNRQEYDADSAYAWLPLRHRLAKMYREAGRVGEAAAIEAELERLLEVADDDHPIKRQLVKPI